MEFRCALTADALPPGKMKRVELNGQRILAAKVDGRYCAVDDTCTHEDASLSRGVWRGQWVKCPLHGSRFNVCTGEMAEEPAESASRTYKVQVVDGQVLLGGFRKE